MSRDPITIAHVVTCLQIGGLERVVVNLAQGFAGHPYRLLVVCLEQGGPFVAEVEKLGGRVLVFGKQPGMSWSTIRRLAQLFRQEHVQIVHTHNPAPHFHGVLAAVLAGVRVRVHTKHGRNSPDIKRRVLLYRVLSWFTNAVVTVSDAARDIALHVEKVNPAKVHRIWNGIDPARYVPASPSHTPVIGTVARLCSDKDQATMLQAFALVLKQVPAARLAIVGDGPLRDDLHAEARRLGITGQVDFRGARDDIPALLPGFTLFTLSSITEGIPMAVLEAMACGVPIVATDVGGCRQIVQPPECGLIVPPRDPAALANAYLELLRDPSRREKMGEAGRQRVIRHFSLETMTREYANLYEELMQRSAAR